MIKNILNNKDKKTIKIIMDEINNNYNKLFNHYNRKYKLDELLKCIIITYNQNLYHHGYFFLFHEYLFSFQHLINRLHL